MSDTFDAGYITRKVYVPTEVRGHLVRAFGKAEPAPYIPPIAAEVKPWGKYLGWSFAMVSGITFIAIILRGK